MSNKTELKLSNDGAQSAQSAVAVRSGGDVRSNTPRNIGLILRREYKNRVTQRSYIISTILLMVLLFLGICVPTVIQFFVSRSNSQSHVTVVNNAGSVAGLNGSTLTQYLDKSLNGSTDSQAQPSSQQKSTPHFAFATSTIENVPQLQKQVKDGKLDILFVLERSASQGVRFTYYTASNGLTDSDLTQIQTLSAQLSVLDRSSRLGLTTAQTQNLLAEPDFKVVHTQADQANHSGINLAAGYLLGTVGTVFIFMAVYLYGMWVANGVAEEKGSRVMEILVNAATPIQLLWGKILGIGAAGLTQMVGLVAVGLIGILFQMPLKMVLLGNTSGGLSLDFLTTSTHLLLLLLLYFILGFLLYATLFAALGALVKRQDEVQNAIGPLTAIFMVGYFASFVGGSSFPDATWFKVMSFIPFWTPTIMMMRIATNTVASWEIGLSVVILLISIVICAWISGRIYRFGVLMYGQKPGWKQLMKLVRQ